MLNIEERIKTQHNLTLHEIEAWYQAKKSQGSELLLDTSEALSFWCGAMRNMEWLIVELYKRKLDEPTVLAQKSERSRAGFSHFLNRFVQTVASQG